MDDEARNNEVDGIAMVVDERAPSPSEVEAYAKFRIKLLNLTPAEVYAALRMLPEDRQQAVMSACHQAIDTDREIKKYEDKRAADEAAHNRYLEEVARSQERRLSSINEFEADTSLGRWPNQSGVFAPTIAQPPQGWQATVNSPGTSLREQEEYLRQYKLQNSVTPRDEVKEQLLEQALEAKRSIFQGALERLTKG